MLLELLSLLSLLSLHYNTGTTPRHGNSRSNSEGLLFIPRGTPKLIYPLLLSVSIFAVLGVPAAVLITALASRTIRVWQRCFRLQPPTSVFFAYTCPPARIGPPDIVTPAGPSMSEHVRPTETELGPLELSWPDGRSNLGERLV